MHQTCRGCAGPRIVQHHCLRSWCWRPSRLGSQAPTVSLQGDIGKAMLAVIVCLGLTLPLLHWDTGFYFKLRTLILFKNVSTETPFV